MLEPVGLTQPVLLQPSLLLFILSPEFLKLAICVHFFVSQLLDPQMLKITNLKSSSSVAPLFYILEIL